MRRRAFITLLSGAAVAWPLGASAQQPTIPVIGSLFSGTPEAFAVGTEWFKRGLKEEGFADGDNLKIEYRWGLGQYDKLPALAAELVERRVAVIVTSGGEPAALAAKAATSTIPIVFGIGGDPVKIGLVTSLNRPGGNATGASLLTPGLERKRLELLCEMKPNAATIAVLVNPSNPLAELQIKEVEQAAQVLGKKILVVQASRDEDLDAAFTRLVQQQINALVVTADPFFYSRRAQLAASSARSAVVAIFAFREFALDGGLMSYGTSPLDIWRITGNYTGRILKGEKPADLPVQQATRVELVLNLKTAKALGISFPIPLLGRADEVIE
jgi:putative tryptophan/tyrosine transport system substrate-binding protein